MFNSIIIALGLTIIWTENTTLTCKTPANGCYYPDTKVIVIGYNSDNIERTFYHEMAHAMFWDEFSTNEELPRMFVQYMKDKEFKNKQPELYWLFENKLKQYEQTNTNSILLTR